MGNTQGTTNSSMVRTVNESLNKIMKNAHANATNHMSLDGVTIECPDYCGESCNANISQVASSAVDFDVSTSITELNKSINDISQKLEHSALGLLSQGVNNISDVYTKNYIENIIDNNCKTDANNNLIIKNSKFKTCSTVLEQNANAESACKANTAVDIARTVSNKVKQETTQNNMIYIIIGVIAAVVVLAIVGIIFLPNSKIIAIIIVIVIIIGVGVFIWYSAVGSKSCESEEDCELNEQCKNGQCEIRTCETDDSKCGIYSTCNTATKKCELKSCVSNTGCSNTQYCNTVTGYCAPMLCRSDADCVDENTKCDTTKGICIVKPASTNTNSN